MSAAEVWRVRVSLPRRGLAACEAALEDIAEACGWFLEDPAGNEDAPDELWCLEGFSRQPVDRAALEDRLALAAAAVGLPPPPAAIERIVDTDWVSANLRDFPPIRAGRFFVHGSHFDARPPGGSVPLQIDAGTAFGSGEHATTQGCLAAIDRLLRRRRFRRPLDLGCGSGILAIAMAKAGRGARVRAADIDPTAVRVAALNARTNRARISVQPSDGYRSRFLRRHRPYDLVTANILARPLASMAADLSRHLAVGGFAVLSGLLVGQERLVLAAHRRHGLALAFRLRINGWSTLVLR
ncbi:MAG TPA: 50S ribosomal protein L11 methyltransferase [Rhodospirillaceae bacterium]|nr:50S ribosomal protein L11 methyltransferase [Rhodospirillaceae bacterium]